MQQGKERVVSFPFILLWTDSVTEYTYDGDGNRLFTMDYTGLCTKPEEREDCGSISNGVKEDDLLLPPQIVGKEYWTRGCFYNVEHHDEILNVKDYGFYSIGKGKFLMNMEKNLLISQNCLEPMELQLYLELQEK